MNSFNIQLYNDRSSVLLQDYYLLLYIIHWNSNLCFELVTLGKINK